MCETTIADYTINGDTVYIDDSNVYLSATPHTLTSSGWVYFNLISKIYTGNIDVCWGFNTTVSKPTKAELYKPHWINTTTNHEKTFFNSTFVIYTGNDLNYGNSYNINYKYTITEPIVNDNGTTYIISNAAFDSFIKNGDDYTIYWHTKHDNYYLWEDFSSSFSSINYNYEEYNKWYYIKNVPIVSNKEYTVRAWIDVPVRTKKQLGKYYFAIKPSHETIAEAVSNGHFYNLDPWWDATWSNRKNITLTGGTSGAQTDYQLLLNITYDSDMQSDFDDLRFTNETHELDSWLESKVDGSYALVWVEFPTTPANGVNQTYYMYYGNAGAANYWDIGATFLLGDDFEDNSIDTDKWDTVAANYNNITETSGQLHLQSTADAQYLHSKISISEDFQVSLKGKTTTSWIGIFPHSDGADNPWGDANMFTFIFDDHNSWIRIEHGGGRDTTAYNFASDTWYIMKATKAGNALNLKLYDANDTYIDEVSATLNNAPSTRIPAFRCSGTGTEDYEYIRIGKYAANPPTYAFGAEEYYYSIQTTLINETKLIMSEITIELKGINMKNYLVYAFILIGILLIILIIQIINSGIQRK